MRTLMWGLVVVNNLALFYFLSLNLKRYRLSAFELRSSLGRRSDPESKMLKNLNKQIHEITTLRMIDIFILISTLSGMLVYLEGSLVGIFYSALLLLLWSLLSRFSVSQALSAQLFELHYQQILQVAQKLGFVLTFLNPAAPSITINSRGELLDVIQTAPSTLLQPTERQRVELLFKAEGKTVKDIMTPKKRVVMIEPATTLGPVVLSDLQKSGHGYFPVATKKGEPEGVLILNDATTIQLTKGRTVVREVMSAHIAGVEEGASLFALAETFLQEKQYLLLVRNEEGEFSGVVTIADLMKHLVGVVKD